MPEPAEAAAAPRVERAVGGARERVPPPGRDALNHDAGQRGDELGQQPPLRLRMAQPGQGYGVLGLRLGPGLGLGLP